MKLHFFYKKSVIQKGRWVASIVLLATVVIEYFVGIHGSFPITDFFAFYAICGFISCLLMVLFAKALGFFIKRKDDYYDL